MKVILEAQHAVGHPQLRGVGTYSLNLIKALLKRNKFDYELSFFDYKNEMQNRTRAEEYFSKYKVPLRECNELDYRIASRDEGVFAKRSYNDYTGTNGDVYHFMCPVTIPTNLKGKMVVTIHDVIWEAYPGIMPQHTEELHKIAAKRINAIKPFVIADSESTKKDILKYTDIPEGNVKVIYLSYDEYNLYPDKADVKNIVDGDYFLFVGAFVRLKNLTTIVKAFNIVAEKYKDIKFVISGKEAWEKAAELYGEISSSKYKDRIILTGYVDDDTKRKLYSNAQAFIFPSLCEGFGIPILEAMACGCPVITANNTSLPEVGGDAAVYVDALDAEQLAYEMEKVFTDNTLRNSLTQKGFLQKNKFSWDKTAEYAEEFYEYCNKFN